MTDLKPSIGSGVLARVGLVDLLESFDRSTTPAALEEVIAAHSRLTDGAPEGSPTWAVGLLLEALLFATKGRTAQWDADLEASRFATAAGVRAGAVIDQCAGTWAPQIRGAAELLSTLDGPDSVNSAAHLLATAPITPQLTDLFQETQWHSPSLGRSQDATPTVALLIRLKNEPVMRPTIVIPSAMHQFKIEARVLEWPSDADQLVVTFAGAYAPDYLFVSNATFTRDALTQPLEIRLAGPRPPEDPPLEITAHAWFGSGRERIQARIVGNTTLELSTFDQSTSTLRDLPATARRVQQLMSELTNALPNLSAGDRTDTRLLLEGVLRFAHTVLDDRLDARADASEAWFQQQLKAFLQADPSIGARLGEAIRRAGGTTDLVLGNIVLELKVEKESAPTVTSAGEHYAAQTTQYGSAGDSQVSLLAVLDVSPKRAPAGVMGNEIAWARPTLAGAPNPRLPSLVGVVIIRAGFPRPSDFSR